jgi:proteasome lid subunit RPN8/RPN11
LGALDARSIEPEGLRTTAFPRVSQGFRVYVAEKAFDHATGRGDAHPDREVGGILVGEVCRDDSGPYVRVDATIDALHADEQGTELTFTHATWEHINKEMDSRHAGKKIVGWYHTHPGFGVFLSDRDVFIHRSFFNLPHQIALVYDPKSREHGVFVWRESEPRRARRHWVGEREHAWEGAHPPRAPATDAEARMPRADPSPAPAAGDPSDRFGLALTGLTILIVGGLVGWLVARWSFEGDLQRIAREVEKERAAGAQDAVRGLNAELLGVLRDSVAGALPAAVDESVGSIDRALGKLKEAQGAPPAAAVEELEAAKQRLDALRRNHDAARKVLDVLAREVSTSGADAKAVREALAVHRALLGQLCAEVAAVTPDKAAARRLLQNAMLIDSGNREAYERRLRELDK